MLGMDRVCCVLTRESSLGEAIRCGCRLVEVRLDHTGVAEGLSLVEEAASAGMRVVATLREAGEGGEWRGGVGEKVDALLRALDAGAWMIDSEYGFRGFDELVSSAPGRVIASMHVMDCTPEPTELLAGLVGAMLRDGAAIAKMVTMARSVGDAVRVLGLNSLNPGRVIAFAMGGRGVLSRILAPLYGAPFTYAHLGESVAPGQLSVGELLELWGRLGLLEPDTPNP
ncbi:MAG: type I 3-dehydroquinate dehydratase [Crenarchaeota archaeon]|nr:type I 3-dehydroquinate dehydratase [Thermoproteota archaeon]